MIIFVNNTPITISKEIKNFDIGNSTVYDLGEQVLVYNKLKGHVIIQNADFKNIFKFLKHAQSNKLSLLFSITFIVEDVKSIKKALKLELEVIKAAGGVVKNSNNKVLMMKRLGFWDLPKGKAEKGEKSETTARREVEEECGVKVKVNDKLCTTWHTYMLKGKMVIKQTKWYNMGLISDQKMKPQKEEGIEELAWMNREEVNVALENSYSSIKHIINKYEVFHSFSNIV